ncbi:MAG: hypothetical protein H7Y04_10965 [Verrucomicrobia bacterium]|nr:hypothetical protein [Cytophagales bacterium]
MDKYSYIANAHTNALDDLYQAYKQNPESVDASWQKFFEGFEFSLSYQENGNGISKNANITRQVFSPDNIYTKETSMSPIEKYSDKVTEALLAHSVFTVFATLANFMTDIGFSLFYCLACILRLCYSGKL